MRRALEITRFAITHGAYACFLGASLMLGALVVMALAGCAAVFDPPVEQYGAIAPTPQGCINQRAADDKGGQGGC